MIARFIILLLIATKGAAFADPTQHEWNPICEHSDAGDFPLHQEQVFGSVTVSVDYVAEQAEDHKTFPKSRVKTYGSCEFHVMTLEGTLLATGRDEYIMPILQADVDGDGTPELIVKTESSGSAGCAKLYVVGNSPPRLIGSVQGCEGLRVEDPNHDGRYVIEAHEGFDLPELDCHTCQPNVPVLLRFHGSRLRDVSSEYPTPYDRAIDEMRAQLRPQHVQALLAARTPREISFLRGFKTASQAEMNHEAFDEVASRAHEYVLRMAVYYLFSGRQGQAWQTLDEMWPLWDRERIKSDILKRLEESRTEGLLKYVSR